MNELNWRSALSDEEVPTIIKIVNVAGWLCLSAIIILLYVFITGDHYTFTQFITSAGTCFFSGIILLILGNIAGNLVFTKNLLRRQIEAMKELVPSKGNVQPQEHSKPSILDVAPKSIFKDNQ